MRNCALLLTGLCSSPAPLNRIEIRADEWVLLRGTESAADFDGVLVLVRPGTKGAIGWKMGAPRSLRELTLKHTETSLDALPRDLPVRDGGPVEPDILSFVYRDPNNGSIHFSRHLPTLLLILQREPHNVLVFRGYSGWGPGQLEAECARGMWTRDSRPPETAFFHE